MAAASASATGSPGERDGSRLLVERHSATSLRLAFRRMQNEQDAEERGQETFLRAHRSRHAFGAGSNFACWIYRIAVNRCYDLLDQRKTRHEVHSTDEPDADEFDRIEQVPASNPSPERSLLSSEIEVRVRLAMKQLTAGERTAFVLRHFEGRSVEEIARVLNVREGAAKNRVHRAVQKLRQQLQPLRTF